VSFAAPLNLDGLSLPVTVADGHCRFETEDATRDLHRLTSWAVDRGVLLDGLDVRKPSLEDVYLRLTADPTEQTEVPA
jgi:ABC-2 type transport system ATP-binding protein